MILHLYLVRHGQTEFNRYNRLQGWCDSPLTEQGIADARRAGERLSAVPFAAAYCSDTTRARVTLRTILDLNTASDPRPPIIDSPFFREQHYGYFEGQDMNLAWWAAGAPHGAPTYAQIVEKYGAAATKDFLKEADPFHAAESDDEYWERIARGYALIGETPTLRDGDDVLQISHGNTLLGLVGRFADPQAGYDLTVRPANGSVTRLDLDTTKPFDESLTVVSYNQ